MRRNHRLPNKSVSVAIALAAFASASASTTTTTSSSRSAAFAIIPRRPPNGEFRRAATCPPATAVPFSPPARSSTMTVWPAGGGSSSSALSLLPPPAAGVAVASRLLLGDLFRPCGPMPFPSSLALNAILFYSLRPKLMTMLTPAGFLHSLALGTMLWTALGYRGWTICVLYLLLGQAVTKVGFEEKERLGIAEGRGGRRGPENVWGSALTGTLCAAAAARALCGGGSFLGLSRDVWILGYVASLSTKLADTFASEIGKAYGRTTFLVTTMKPVPRGTEGAVSLEGTLASVIGGFLLSAYAYGVVGLVPSVGGMAVSAFAAFVATMAESVIGATLQGREGWSRWMTNEVVNFLNTLIGAAVAMSLGVLVLGM